MGVLTEPYHGVGYVTDEYGQSQEIEIDLSGQETSDQETYDLTMLVWANELGLYEKRGLDFHLTQEGLRVAQERQNLTDAETRELIRNAMRQRTHLKVLSEEQYECNDRGAQPNPVEIGASSVLEIFSAEKTENLGARVQPQIEE